MFQTVAVAFGAAAVSSLVLSKLWPLLLRDKADAMEMLYGPTAALVLVSAPVVLLSFGFGAAAVRSLDRAFLQAAALGAWVGPLFLVDAVRAPLFVLAAVLLAPGVARLFGADSFEADERGMFDLLAGGDGGVVWMIAAAVALQLSVIAVGNFRFGLASLLVFGALVAGRRLVWRRRSDSPKPRFAALVVGALGLAFIGMMPLGGGDGMFAGVAQLPPAEPKKNDGGDHDGLFLYPKAERVMALIPVPPSLRNDRFASSEDTPFRVPFFGLYWVFRYPELEPPVASFRGEGDPEGMNLRSMDGRPIKVEARQNFGRYIDLRCCSRIQVEVRNGDRYPGTIRMELILADSKTAKDWTVSLGSQELRSTQRIRLHDGRAVKETVEYAIQPGTAPFDEAILRFHLDRSRQRRAGKIAVEAFVFVPRRAV